MRRLVISAAALGLALAAQAMPLGLRTAMWGVARAGGGGAVVWDDPIPALPADATPDAVAAALSGSRDARLAENIRDASDYAAYYGWVGGVTNAPHADADAVKSSPYAWLSFALGADRLIGKDVLPEDVRIVSFDAGSGDVKEPLAFEVAIDGVEIGGGQVAMETLKANLAKVLGVEGSARLDKKAFSSDGIKLSIEAPENGKAKFTIQAPENAGGSYFMRVKIAQ